MRQIGNYCDDETAAIMKGLPMLPPADQSIAAQYARERKEAFIAGRAMVPDFWQEALSSFDPLLRARWEIDQRCIVVDIWVEQWGYWQTVMVCLNPDGTPMRTGDQELRDVIATLYRSNVQKLYHNSKEMLTTKRAQAAATKAVNAVARTEAMKAVVDSMSNRQVDQFIEVHRAIHRGETIVAHGADEKILETYAKSSAAAPPVPTGKAFNAGMHPLTYKRKKRVEL